MKTIFGQEFLEQRKKLVEFAKIAAEPQSPPPDLNGIGNSTATMPMASNANQGPAANIPPKSPPILPTIPPPNLPPSPSRANPAQSQNTQIERSQTGTKPPPPPAHLLKQQEQARQQQQDDGVFKQEPPRSQPTPVRNSAPRPHTTTSTNLRSRTSSAYRQPEGFDFAAALPTILFVLLLGGLGGYLFMKRGHLKFPNLGGDATAGSATETSSRSSSRMGHIDIAQTGTYVVSIQSNPSGAQIIIDGQVQNSFTPAQITVEANKEFSLGLRKEGHFPYETTLKATQNAMTFKASMQQMLKIGYISINVVNGGNAPVVSINGQRLIEKMPIKSYAVPAGVPLTIRAYNPFTGLSAEQTLVIDSNQKKLIELILGINKK